MPDAGVPPKTPVLVLKVTPLGKGSPLNVNVGAGKPVVVTAKLPAVPTENVVLFADVIVGA